MSNKIMLVKMLTNDDGTEYDKDNQVWHLVVRISDSLRTFCGGEVFGEGESQAKFVTKEVQRGITCPQCKNFIKFIKSVKL
jgi:hypothetical protein